MGGGFLSFPEVVRLDPGNNLNAGGGAVLEGGGGETAGVRLLGNGGEEDGDLHEEGEGFREIVISEFGVRNSEKILHSQCQYGSRLGR